MNGMDAHAHCSCTSVTEAWRSVDKEHVYRPINPDEAQFSFRRIAIGFDRSASLKYVERLDYRSEARAVMLRCARDDEFIGRPTRSLRCAHRTRSANPRKMWCERAHNTKLSVADGRESGGMVFVLHLILLRCTRPDS